MRAKDGLRTGGEILADQLVINGVRHAFCVPGESYIAALDALYGGPIALTVCRQEGGAAMMAEAAGKATGHPGICFVTRGPGAANAFAGLHVARQDSTPMILFVGQVGRNMREREAFQELDYRAVFGPIAKWATEIDDAARVPELVSRAFHTAANGRPGPVVVALPEDMLSERVAAADVPAFAPIETAPGAAEVEQVRQLLAVAARPLVIAGGSRWSAEASAALMHFVGRFELPLVTSFRRTHIADALHPSYAGDLGSGPNPKLLARIKAADRVLLIGGRLGEWPSQGYTLLDVPVPKQTLIHVHPGIEELGRVYRPHLAVHATPTAFVAALDRLPTPNENRWRDETRAAHADYIAFSEKPTAVPGRVNLGEIVVGLRDTLPPDAVISTGAGNFSIWVQRFYRHRRYGTLAAPTSGSMGYGLPAAVAMQRLQPDRMVVAFCGDGDFLMTGQEFATAVQYELPLVAIVVDNGLYGTIRMHQERLHPGRVIGTELRNPDFAAYARAFGGFGATVETTAEFAPAFEAARRSRKPAIIHVKVDPEAITPGTTLSAIRKQARERA
ncbi:MAG: thiamine pyrophosphate-binding protein [Hyphomicrobiales bacterium]|nr:thiamine pyrophosphate-binding protein [Hyphomicrobiales bacterium]